MTKKKSKINKIKRIIKLTYASAFLKNCRPLSLMIIAPPSQSKTHFLLSYKTKYSYTITDLSFMGLINLLVENPKLKHIKVPDFLKLTEKKASTKDNLLSFLNSFLEEGIFEVKLGNQNKLDLKGKKGGIITATTKASYEQNKKKWENTGFISRFLIVSYQYSNELISEIMDSINNGDEEIKTENINYKQKYVKIKKEHNDKLKQLSLYNIRKYNNLRILIKTIALTNQREETEEKDIEELIELNEILNDYFTTI